MHILLFAALAALGRAHFSEPGGAVHTNQNRERIVSHPGQAPYAERRRPHRHFDPVPIISDCVGDMRAEPKKCVCRKQYGFFKSTCSAGQQCYRGDGTCLDFQEVTCTYEGSELTGALSAFYLGPWVAFESDDNRDDKDPRVSMYTGPLDNNDEDGSISPEPAAHLVLDKEGPPSGSGNTGESPRESFEFTFTDMGPDYDLVFAMRGFDPELTTPWDTCSLDRILQEVMCVTDSGPWNAGVNLMTLNGSANLEEPISFRRRRLHDNGSGSTLGEPTPGWVTGGPAGAGDGMGDGNDGDNPPQEREERTRCPKARGDNTGEVDCGSSCHEMPPDEDRRYTDYNSSENRYWCMPNDAGHRDQEFDLFVQLARDRKRGRWTGSTWDKCESAVPMDRARAFNPYAQNNAVTCNIVDEVGLGEIGCGAMRNAGTDCCYNNGQGRCGFNRRCKYDGGLFVLPNNDWEVEMFGNPEKNHLHDLSPRLIAGRARVPNGAKVVPYTHSHGDDAIDAVPPTDDGKADGNDGAYDDRVGPGEEPREPRPNPAVLGGAVPQRR